MHAFKVDDHIAGFGGELRDAPQQLLGRAEEQGALCFEHSHFVSLARQDLALIGRAQAI